jgi:hypothetical protein
MPIDPRAERPDADPLKAGMDEVPGCGGQQVGRVGGETRRFFYGLSVEINRKVR